MNIASAQHIYFAGIGGIGMSGLAQLLHADEKRVSGSDIASSPIIERLQEIGIPIRFEQTSPLPEADIDILIYSDALPEDHPERNAARQAGIPEMSYFSAVGEYAKQFMQVIAVSGTHGKSTTTAMIAKIFLEAEKNPTVLVGSILPEQKTNAIAGGKEFFIVEACEHQAHMLKIQPTVAVITNIEADHLDYYRDLQHIKDTFQQWIDALPNDGIVVAGNKMVSEPGRERTERDTSRAVSGDGSRTVIIPKQQDFNLLVPGKHNQSNALLAASVAQHYGIDDGTIRHALESYKGLWRRFEVKGEYQGATVISDYAHHPTEIRATIQAAREQYPNRCIAVLFQPHQRARTKALFTDFVDALADAQLAIVQEIYDVAGREDDSLTISSKDIVNELETQDVNAFFAQDSAASTQLLKKWLVKNDVLLIMGAGDIYQLADQLTKTP